VYVTHEKEKQKVKEKARKVTRHSSINKFSSWKELGK
jgi:hypothetical protein